MKVKKLETSLSGLHSTWCMCVYCVKQEVSQSVCLCNVDDREAQQIVCGQGGDYMLWTLES